MNETFAKLAKQQKITIKIYSLLAFYILHLLSKQEFCKGLKVYCQRQIPQTV
jgi:hypothetical protein